MNFVEFIYEYFECLSYKKKYLEEKMKNDELVEQLEEILFAVKLN